MKHPSPVHNVLSILIAAIWMANGLFCKVLNLVPRHQLIVSNILGVDYATLLTRTIGVLEVGMAVWIITGYKSRWCAITQIVVVVIMNIIEFLVVPDLLLFGRFNAVLAFVVIIAIYGNAFLMNRKVAQPTLA